MRTGVPPEHRGFFHEAATYGSDAELLDLVVPWAESARGAGEPTVISLRASSIAAARAPTVISSSTPALAACAPTARCSSASWAPSSSMSPRTATRRPAASCAARSSRAARMESGLAL